LVQAPTHKAVWTACLFERVTCTRPPA